MDFLIDIDKAITVAVNGWNSDFIVDGFMLYLSKVWVWVPLYLIIIIALFRRLGWKKALIAVAILAAAFAFTDKFSYFLKENICRLRPCEDPTLSGVIHCIEKRGSLYGFPSGHACNTFCFALISSHLFKKKGVTAFLFLWAAIVSYSRIYVGKHFFGDILAGALLGLAIGALAIVLYQVLTKRLTRPKCSA
jgi:Membrane-associated phospholipid phosphatase